MTFLIPIVNVATTLHSLAAEASPRPLPLIPLPPCLDPASNFPSRERNQLGESYRTAAAAVTAKHTAEKLMDQAKVLDKLEGMEGKPASGSYMMASPFASGVSGTGVLKAAGGGRAGAVVKAMMIGGKVEDYPGQAMVLISCSIHLSP